MQYRQYRVSEKKPFLCHFLCDNEAFSWDPRHWRKISRIFNSLFPRWPRKWQRNSMRPNCTEIWLHSSLIRRFAPRRSRLQIAQRQRTQQHDAGLCKQVVASVFLSYLHIVVVYFFILFTIINQIVFNETS